MKKVIRYRVRGRARDILYVSSQRQTSKLCPGSARSTSFLSHVVTLNLDLAHTNNQYHPLMLYKRVPWSLLLFRDTRRSQHIQVANPPPFI